jgi:hypothetical protein
MNNLIIPTEVIEHRIYFICQQKVMLDRDLAELYGIRAKVLNQAVKRNLERFPEDFMFQLTTEESELWLNHIYGKRSRSQFVTLKRGENIKYQPYAFTEHGILMLSSVLRSERAILASQKDLMYRLDELEKKYDKHFQFVFDAIRQLMVSHEKPKHPIGFKIREPKAAYHPRNQKKRNH